MKNEKDALVEYTIEFLKDLWDKLKVSSNHKL